METVLPDFSNAVWYKVTKDRSVQLVPVFIDYNLSTSMGTMLYDKEISPCKLASELPTQSSDDPKAWYLHFDLEDASSLKAAGIIIPDTIESADTLFQVRAMFNRKHHPIH